MILDLINGSNGEIFRRFLSI